MKPYQILILVFFTNLVVADNLFSSFFNKNQITTWKILFVIATKLDAVDNQGKKQSITMSPDDIEAIKQKAPLFKGFVEQNTNGKIKIDLTVKVLDKPLGKLETSPTFSNYPSFLAVDNLLGADFTKYDSYIITFDSTGLNTKGWWGLTFSNYSLLNFKKGTFKIHTPADKLSHTNVYVHEWLHQLERYYPKINPKYATPNVHNYQTQYLYQTHNPKLTVEEVKAKFYSDYLKGTLQIPAGSKLSKGIDSSWWQYHPLDKPAK
jgi:hypothetical protein